MKRVVLFTILIVVLLVTIAYAADPKKLPSVGSWGPIIGAFINGVVVLLIVKGLLFLKPIVMERFPWLWAMLGGILGYVLTPIQNFLSTFLNYPIDLSPVLGVFAAALGAFVAIANHKHTIVKMARMAGSKVGLIGK